MSLSRVVLPDIFPVVAQMSQEMIDVSHQNEIERLRDGGVRQDGAGDFVIYVITPLAIVLCLVLLGRRILS
ncbi:MAG: hypothetical protein V4662_01050 [Verrucomicrobiota bacterium]